MSTPDSTNPDGDCQYCHGYGRYEFADPKCPECKGKGTVEVDHSHGTSVYGTTDPYTTRERCRCTRWAKCKHFRKWDKAEKYATQSDIVRQALATPTHSLDELLCLMRRSGQAAVYLAGTRLDNDNCFGSDDVGMLFSVLPQDAQKAAEPGYHPGSTEVYVTFQGGLVMECLQDGQVRAKTVNANEVLVLPPGQCHRVCYDAQREAASVIVKTTLNAKPSVVRCTDCTYYPNPTACPLAQRWSDEKRPW